MRRYEEGNHGIFYHGFVFSPTHTGLYAEFSEHFRIMSSGLIENKEVNKKVEEQYIKDLVR